MCEGVQSAGQYCNNIVDRHSTFGSLNWRRPMAGDSGWSGVSTL